MNDYIPHIVSLLAGGGAVAAINAIATRGKTKAEAENTSIRSLLEVDERMNLRMTGLETRLAGYEEKIAELRSEILELEADKHRLQLMIDSLESSIERKRDE